MTRGVHEKMIEDSVRLGSGHAMLAAPGYLEDRSLDHFLEPSLAHAHHFTSGTSTKIILAVISVIAGFIGISFAVMVWLKGRVRKEGLEPAFLENAMYVDASYAKVVGGVGTQVFQLAADGDKKLVDGAVNGVGWVTRKTGELIRPAQSGYLRNYAIGVAVGALALIAWLVVGVSL